MSNFCLKIRIFSNHISLGVFVWVWSFCLFRVFSFSNYWLESDFSTKMTKDTQCSHFLVMYNWLACSKNILIRNLHCHHVHFFWNFESTTWSIFVIRTEVLKNIFCFLMNDVHKAGCSSCQTELEELHKCCHFKILWKSMEIFLPWIHTGIFHKFSNFKLLLSLNLFLCWLCYITYCISFVLLFFYSLSPALPRWTIENKYWKDGPMGKMLTHIFH